MEGVDKYICIYRFLLHKQDVTQGQFFKQSLTDLNSTNGWKKNSWMYTFLKCSMRCERPCPGFELGSPCPFSTTLYHLFQCLPMVYIGMTY